MADLSRLSLNTVMLQDQWTLPQCIEGCARHGIPGYRGMIAVEILSRAWWQRDPDQVLATIKDRFLAYV